MRLLRSGSICRTPGGPGRGWRARRDAPGVSQRHSRVVPKATLKPRAQVVHHLHPLQADWVVGVCPVRLAIEPAVPDQHTARSLDVEGRLVGDASQLGRALDGNVVAHEPDERTRTGSGLWQCSRTMLLWEAKLLLQEHRSHLGMPAAVDSSLQVPCVVSRAFRRTYERPPGGIVIKQSSGWALGYEFIVICRYSPGIN